MLIRSIHCFWLLSISIKILPHPFLRILGCTAGDQLSPLRASFLDKLRARLLSVINSPFSKLAPPSLFDHIWKYGGVINLQNIPSNIHLRFKIDWLQLHILNHSEIEILWSASRRHIWENNWLKLFWSTKLTLVDKKFWWTKKFNYIRYDLSKPNFNQTNLFWV